MNKNLLVILALVLLIGGAIGAVVYFTEPAEEKKTDEPVRVVAAPMPSTPPIQQELNDLSTKMVAQLKNEERLNLNMVAQVRAHEELMRHIQGYAAKVERSLAVIEEISKDEFQQDVTLQASLFGGKKADLIAGHLEEFRASRVGAILAKMKEKEASAVLDVWSKQKSAKVSSFYREVMAAYLNNRRRDADPELFNQLAEGEKSEPPRG
jgi:flagellar motility protein MotE (MotC chaperone)